MNRSNVHYPPMMGTLPSYAPEVDHTLIKDPMERYLTQAPEQGTPERVGTDDQVNLFIQMHVCSTKVDGWGRRRLYGIDQPKYAHPNYESRFHLMLDELGYRKNYKE